VEDDSSVTITQGFRPILTPDGLDSSIFRFFPDKSQSQKWVEQDSPPLFWYCHNVFARPESTVFAVHPTDLVPGTMRRAPILVVSQYGAGRTLFSAIDDSWRWRFYTGENIFSTYWIQQIRYLARNRKLDERKVLFESLKPDYQIGDQVGLTLTVLSPQLAHEMPPQIPVDILDSAGQPAKRVMMLRLASDAQRYSASWSADSVGHFVARLPSLGDAASVDRPFVVEVPQMELEHPEVDRALLGTLGQPVDVVTARAELPKLLHSAAKTIPVEWTKPLWSMPVVMGLFALLITVEWVVRKANGMV